MFTRGLPEGYLGEANYKGASGTLCHVNGGGFILYSFVKIHRTVYHKVWICT